MMLLQKIIMEFDKPACPAGWLNSYKWLFRIPSSLHLMTFKTIFVFRFEQNAKTGRRKKYNGKP